MARERTFSYKGRTFTVAKHPLCWLWHEEGTEVVYTALSERDCYLNIGGFVRAGESDGRVGIGFDTVKPPAK